MDFADFSHVPGAPASSNPRLLADLAADLTELDYSVDGVAELLGAEAWAAFDRDQLVPAELATSRSLEDPARGRLAAVVRFWLLGNTVEPEQLAPAFPRTGLDGLGVLGLLEHDDGALRAAVDLRPYGFGSTELWVASDLGAHQRPGVLRRDHVLGIGQASLTLAQLTVRTDVERALDLGTGCGIQVFHLLGHCRHVTATDISERALAFTRFNLVLNAGALGLDPERLGARVSLRLGSLLEPVAGERFDLVVTNPPFVITPRRPAERAEEQFTYRDGGLPGDDIVGSLFRTLPSVLADGGVAQMLGNWEIPAGAATWHARLEQWLSPDTDAWVIQREQLSPAQYAETWLRDAAENRDPALFASAYAAYLDDFDSRAVEAVGFGMVWLRRPPAGSGQTREAALRRFEEITYPIEQPIGPHLAAAVERSDWLAAHAADFGRQHLEVARDVTEERHQRPGAEHPGVILLRQGAGLRRANLMSTELAGFVSASDGELDVDQIIGALASLLGRTEPDFARQLSDEVRNLVADGFLVPTGQ
ncbi:methyltransferase [Arthrobacter sulfonylureivorans]|uniref:DUF7059 domain-containing protein n=1 Tax=Arthrobacter sulfonylureivorans TaxID=2486855 RepID=UPI0039E28A98